MKPANRRTAQLSTGKAETFRNPSRTKRLKAHGLEQLKPELHAAFEAHRKDASYAAKLNEQLLAPIGKLLGADRPSRKAMATLRSISRKSLKQDAALAANVVIAPPAHTMAVWTHLGSNLVIPPMDEGWTDKNGSVYAAASKQAGTATVSLSAGDADENQYGAAGVLLWYPSQRLIPFSCFHSSGPRTVGLSGQRRARPRTRAVT
jgi:hypothetical protein